MATTVQRTPKSGRQSLFFNDLATPVSSRRGKFSTPGQAAAVSALWHENFPSSDLPPPPVFTLEDRSDFSSELGFMDYPMSPESKSDPRTPVQSSVREFSSPLTKVSEVSTSNVLSASQQNHQGSLSLNWWSPGKSDSEQEDKGKGSPVEGVVQPAALMTLPPPREVARPEMQSSVSVGHLNEEEWVTVYGFSPGDTNLVLREFEKCGVILKHVLGPQNANWMHILYQNQADARKALGKNGMQINGVLIVGVKLVDPLQCRALNERANNQGFMTLRPSSSSTPPSGLTDDQNTSRTISRRQSLQNGTGTIKQTGAMGFPAKSLVSKVVDLMFGV